MKPTSMHFQIGFDVCHAYCLHMNNLSLCLSLVKKFRIFLSMLDESRFEQSVSDRTQDWVEAVKHDCIFGSDLVLDEVTAVSQVWFLLWLFTFHFTVEYPCVAANNSMFQVLLFAAVNLFKRCKASSQHPLPCASLSLLWFSLCVLVLETIDHTQKWWNRKTV
jgi:hypothetical protein